MRLGLFFELLVAPEPRQLFSEEDVVKGKVEHGKGWFNTENNEFFMLQPGQAHWDNSCAKKMEAAGWLDRHEGESLEAARDRLFDANGIVRFEINTRSGEEPVLAESGAKPQNREYVGLMKLVRAKAAPAAKAAGKVVWAWGAKTGKKLVEKYPAQDWLPAAA